MALDLTWNVGRNPATLAGGAALDGGRPLSWTINQGCTAPATGANPLLDAVKGACRAVAPVAAEATAREEL